MGKNKEKDAMERDAAAQERTAAAQEDVAGSQQAFFEFLKSQGIEDRQLQQQIYQEISPFAERLMNTYDPAQYADLERPDRPDLSDFYKRAYMGEMADIQDFQNQGIADAASFYRSQGLSRSGVQGRGYGSIRAGADSERTGARTRLSDNLAGEKLAGFEDRLGGYYDALNRRNADVGIATTGAGLKTGQQSVFNPNNSFGMASGNLASAGGTYGGAGSTFGSAAGTRYSAAQLPGTWSRIGGIARGIADVGMNFLPGGQFAQAASGFMRRGGHSGYGGG